MYTGILKIEQKKVKSWIKIFFSKKEYFKLAFPTDWKELSFKDLKWLAERFEHLVKPSQEFLIQFFLHIVKESKLNVRERVAIQSLTSAEVVEIIENLNYLTKLDTISITALPFERLNKYYPPQESLANSTVNEFVYADTYFQQYLQNQDEEYLDAVIACLYRPKKKALQKAGATNYSEDKRVPFNINNINFHAANFKKTARWKKYIVLLFFWGCRNEIINSNHHIFSKENKAKADSYGWLSVLFEIAGDKMGTYENVKKLNALEALSFMNREIEKAKEREQELNQNNA